MKNYVALFCICLISAVSNKSPAASQQEVWQTVVSNTPVVKSDQELELAEIYQRADFPNYEVNLARMIKKTSNGWQDELKTAVERTLNENDDFYPVIDKLLHANGICFQGVWEITGSSDYTGLLKKGTRVAVIGRASTTLSGVKHSEKRGFAMALKLFPENDYTLSQRTENIFFIDVLAGRLEEYFLKATMTNQPSPGISFDFALLAHVVKTFGLADWNPGYRPVDHITQVDTRGQNVAKHRAPKWMALRPSATNKPSKASDFRTELQQSALQQPLVYEIWTSQKTSSFSEENYQKVGAVTLTEPTISYGCDRRLHFGHPKISKN
jgi:hypothetical protein